MKMKAFVTTVLLVLSTLAAVSLGIAPIAQARAEIVGEVGTYFEITDSTYLNITLASSEVVRVLLESVPRMVYFFIESNGSQTTTHLTLTGFEPDITYYRYQDGYLIEDFTIDASGEYTYSQDISELHHVFIQETPSTIYIGSDYTFTSDIYEPIVVTEDDIVIDGNGYTLDGPGHGYGFYLSGRSGVTIKNVVIKDWTYGVSESMSIYGGNNIVGNTISDNSQGIGIVWSIGSFVSSNLLANNGRGISIEGCGLISVGDNTITGSVDGIYIGGYSADITVAGNKLSGNTRGIRIQSCLHANGIIRSNTLSTNGVGIYVYRSTYNRFYHNRFINNEQQTLCRSGLNEWDDGYPSGGNYWSDYTGVDEYSGSNQDEPGSDGIGDTPYDVETLGVDHYPLTAKRVAVAALEDQRAVIESWDFDQGFQQQLTAKIDEGIGLIERGNFNGARRKLGDLIKKVTNDAKYLTQEQKDYIIQATQDVIDFIE